MFTFDELDAAKSIVQALVPPTPAYAWPLLARRVGAQVIVKHENHTPTGSFKARGGLVYVEMLKREGRLPSGLITATRGNHGQSVAIAGKRAGIPVLIVVPDGNSAEKNAAMEAFGGELMVAGRDFDEARVIAAELARDRGFHFVPSFHRSLVMGVATYAMELLTSFTELHRVYVPIGMGSGICAMIVVRDLLSLSTEIVGVVAEKAPAFALSAEAGYPVSTETARTFADGLACRQPLAEPFEIMRKGALEIVRVTEAGRAGHLPPELLRGATFTITNFGTEGGRFATPIVLPPQVAILGFGAVRVRPVVDGDAVVAAPTLPVSLSADHRVIDGRDATAFLEHVLARLRDPATIDAR